ncbi:hypothetical protein [Eubacterium aggregans]
MKTKVGGAVGIAPSKRRAGGHMPVRLDVDLHKGYVHLPFVL